MSYKEIEDHDASTDTAVAARFEFLDLLYPDSKFILTIRDLDSWIDSAASLTRSANDPIWKLESRSRLWGSFVFYREKFIEGYHKHHSKVLHHFRNRPNDFLILDLKATEKFEKLCSFLNKPTPSDDYPHLNKRGS
jgi:hypothetical protein